MTIETEEQLRQLRRVGELVANCLQKMLSSLEEGMSTWDLDQIGREYLESRGARSAPEKCYQFPGATCISLDHEAAHGIPAKNKFIRKNMLINVDVSAELDGYFADTGASLLFQSKDKRLQHLCKSTRKALRNAIAEVKAGVPLNVIGRAIEKEARKSSHKILRNLCSHGVGQALHEDPTEIPPYYDRSDRRMIKKGMVFTIEPFLTTGSEYAEEADDHWTLVNERNFFSAQYEHTMVATPSGVILLTIPSEGEPFKAIV
ncbi:MAG: type I methionyl aminopeptidase [Oligoflexus sp.]